METLILRKFLLFSLLVVTIASCNDRKRDSAQGGIRECTVPPVDHKALEVPEADRSQNSVDPVKDSTTLVQDIRNFVFSYERQPNSSLLAKHMTPHAGKLLSYKVFPSMMAMVG